MGLSSPLGPAHLMEVRWEPDYRLALMHNISCSLIAVRWGWMFHCQLDASDTESSPESYTSLFSLVHAG